MWAGVGHIEVELRYINTVISECNPPICDVAYFNTVPDVKVHSSNVKGEWRSPSKANNISLGNSN